MSLQEKIEALMDQEQMHTFEGRRGVANLCKLVRALGYKDPNYGGQLESGAYLNDLLLFLEDNSGAIEAIVEWVGKRKSHEWNDSISALLINDNEGDEDGD